MSEDAEKLAQPAGSGGSNTTSKSESLNKGKIYPVWRTGGQVVNPRLDQRARRRREV